MKFMNLNSGKNIPVILVPGGYGQGDRNWGNSGGNFKETTGAFLRNSGKLYYFSVASLATTLFQHALPAALLPLRAAQ
jgi:hypothetical protein